ncbi:MAG: Tn3 family transposase [Inquilinus sp.]|uniref:Tn3 family transposase n=1 Tax=Inquilinus sp. TaxID=1932117 RepID=UPI003F325E26
MSKRPLLKTDRWAALLAAPVDEMALAGHCTLDPADLDLIRTKTASHNQLGLALQLCLLNHSGRQWRHDEVLPPAMVAFVAEQIDVSPDVLAEYAKRDQTRREHAAEAQRHLGLHGAGRDDRRAALAAALEAADATDQGQPIAEAMIAALRNRHAVLPAADTLDRIGRGARALARRRMEAALLDGLPAERLDDLDRLLVVDPEIRISRFAWLKALPEAPGKKNLLALLERLRVVRGFALDPRLRGRIHPDRWRQLVREGQATPAHLAADLNAGRRRATIACQLIELGFRLTDAAVAMFCRLVGRQFARARVRRNNRHLKTGRSAGELLGLFRATLRTLSEANETDSDAIELLHERIGWHRLMQAQAELESFEGTDEPDPVVEAAERSDLIRRCGQALIEDLVFRSARRSDPLLAALELLRQLYREGRRVLPARPPVGHLDKKIVRAMFAAGKPERKLYEAATLAALRGRLRSGDVWVVGGRTFRPLAADLVPAAVVKARKEADDLRLGVPPDPVAWLAEKREEVTLKLQQLANRARAGKLKGVRLVDGKLVVSPERSAVPKAAEAAKWLILDRMPLVKITELIAEVDAWTGFSEAFTHLHTGDLPRNILALHAGLLADAINLGPKRIAEASAGVTARQIGWCRQFHAHDPAFKAGVARIINAQLAHPYARIWGDTASSSDGQFFPAAGRAGKRSDVNTHYSHGPGGKFYTWVSDRYGHYYILPIGVTESEAAYVLDGIYGHVSELDIAEHYIGTGGAADHVFALFAVLGRRLVPRLRNLKDWSLYTFADADPLLRQHVGGRIDEWAIREAWDEVLRIGLSIEGREVAPSVLLKKLAAMPKTNLLVKALREIGRIERTLFMIEWYSSPALRARCRAGLNKGEAGHKLVRAVFFHERGEIRDAAFESQAFRASALNLVVSAIILWNTVYLSRVVDQLRAEGHDLPDEILRHVSPQLWEHINLTGTYDWSRQDLPPSGDFRQLRGSTREFRTAA